MEPKISIVDKIGFIGAGNMAKAIGFGLVQAGTIHSSQLYVSAPSDRNLSEWKSLGANTTNVNSTVVENSDVIFIAVKPHLLDTAIESIKSTLNRKVSNKLFISILAATTLDVLQEKLSAIADGVRVIRVMPNTPVTVNSGVSVFSAGKTATEADKLLVQQMFSTIGIIEYVPESLINAVGALAGSGPAFVYIMIEALSDGGVKMGIPRPMAIKFAAQTLLGSAKMVLSTGRHPAQLKDEVCSAGGTTITGVHAMEHGGVRGALIDAVEAAVKRSEELSKKFT